MRIFKLILASLLLMISSVTYSSEKPSEDGSLYDLEAHLIDQNGQKIGLDIFRGHLVVASMFYASCNYSCPVLIDSLKNLDAKLDNQTRENIRYLLISFDPEHDTPAILKKLSADGKIDSKRWILASPSPLEVREIAAILNFTYRALPEGGFNHSSSLTLLDNNGRPLAYEEGAVQSAESMLAHIKNFFNPQPKEGAL